ncbi:acyl-CoA thioesterase [Bacteroidota bacterium]
MYTHEISFRVRYGETDKMGYVYHGKYAQYFDMGRTELMRSLGLSYNKLEDSGVLLPVKYLSTTFIKPGMYDDVLTLKTHLQSMPTVKIKFNYELFNQNNELISTAETTLAFIDENTRRPIRPPADFLSTVGKYFK